VLRSPQDLGVPPCTCKASASGPQCVLDPTARQTAWTTCCSLPGKLHCGPRRWKWSEGALRSKWSRFVCMAALSASCCLPHHTFAWWQMFVNESRVLEVLRSCPGHVLSGTVFVSDAMLEKHATELWVIVQRHFQRWCEGAKDSAAEEDVPLFTPSPCCDDECAASQVCVDAQCSLCLVPTRTS